ncbi:MAG: hypothetical protein KC502_11370 [Myxococcales bacterium]|nr:hypothetical protein [Myxococcales bacterium]
MCRPALSLLLTCSLAFSPCVYASETSSAALTVSRQALEAYKAKRYKQAATLYRAAWHTNPGELTYLYNAARAFQLAGFLKDSERDYVNFLMKAPAKSAAVTKARKHLDEVRRARRKRREANKRKVIPPAAPAPRPQSTGTAQRTAGWILLAGGLVVAGVGGGVLLVASSDQAELNRKLAITKIIDGEKKIVGISKIDADSETTRLDNQFYLGWGLAGAGAVGLTIGALLLATAPAARVSLSPWPNGRGMGLTMQF